MSVVTNEGATLYSFVADASSSATVLSLFLFLSTAHCIQAVLTRSSLLIQYLILTTPSDTKVVMSRERRNSAFFHMLRRAFTSQAPRPLGTMLHVSPQDFGIRHHPCLEELRLARGILIGVRLVRAILLLDTGDDEEAWDIVFLMPPKL